MTNIEIAAGVEDIAQLRALWTEVATRAGGAGAFERFELVLAAAQLATRRGSEPLVVSFRGEGGVRSLLALRRERLLGVCVAVPLLRPLAQYTDAIGQALSPRDLSDLCKRLALRRVDLLLLTKVREDGGLHAALVHHGRSQKAGETAHWIDLSAYGTFAAYDASFSNKTRRNRRQRLQRFESQVGPLSFEVLRGTVAAAAFETALAWKRLWLAQRGISSPVFDSGDWEGILRAACGTGAIVTALKAGGRQVAIEVGFQDRTSYLAYLGAYDESFRTFSPGQEQMLRTIAWCFEQGFTRYDLMAPADDYKCHLARCRTGVGIDDYAIALTRVGHGVAELRRHVRPIARDFYHKLSPEVRVAGGRYAVPAAAVAAAAAAGAVISAID